VGGTDASIVSRGPEALPASLPLAARGVFPPISFRLWDRYNKLRGLDDILASVSLPKDEYLSGWVAVHLVDFWRDVASVWDVIAKDMSAQLYLRRFRPGEGYPPGAMYFLEGGGAGEHDGSGSATRSPLLPAPVYAQETIAWIGERVAGQDMNHLALDRNEEADIFRAYEHQNPKFAVLSGKIIRRTFRVYGIIYCSMYRIVERLEIAPYLNEVFERFIFFCFEFDLLSTKEVEPLAKLVYQMRKRFQVAKNNMPIETTTVSVCREDVAVASSGRTIERATFSRKAASLKVQFPDNPQMLSQEVVVSPKSQDEDEIGNSSHGSITIGKTPHLGYF